MNVTQNLLINIFMPITLFFIVLDNVYPDASFVNYLKFASITALFLTSVKINKKHFEQRLLSVSMFFVMVGDIFLVLGNTLLDSPARVMPFGVLSFSIAYLVVISALQKNFSINWRDLLSAAPVLVLAVPVTMKLFPYVSGFMRYGLLLFICILCYCSWSCICAIFRGYFAPASSRRIAVAGVLMLTCDLGVGLSIFHPDFAGHFVPWLKNLVWGSYIPAWTLIVVTVAEDNLILHQEN